MKFTGARRWVRMPEHDLDASEKRFRTTMLRLPLLRPRHSISQRYCVFPFHRLWRIWEFLHDQ